MVSGSSVIINGIEYYLIKTLADYFNFTYKTINCKYQWGRLVNGVWNGLIGTIVNGTADMALGALSANKERQLVVDFTKPYLQAAVTFITIREKREDPVIDNLLFKAFPLYIWLVLISLITASSIVASKLGDQTFMESLFLIFRSFLQNCMYFLRTNIISFTLDLKLMLLYLNNSTFIFTQIMVD